jgi:hypothetical protein
VRERVREQDTDTDTITGNNTEWYKKKKEALSKIYYCSVAMMNSGEPWWRKCVQLTRGRI